MKRSILSMSLAAVLLGTVFIPVVGEAISLPYSTTATKKVLCYMTAGGQQKGWIDPGDNIIIKGISGSWAYVNYPISKGRTERWCPLTEVYRGTGASGISLPYSTRAPQKALCYLCPGGQQKGWIDAGDDITIKLIDGNWALVNYPTSSGRLERWCVLGEVYRTQVVPKATTTPIVKNNPVITTVNRTNTYSKIANGFYKIKSANVNRYLNANSTGIKNGTNVSIYDNLQYNCQTFYLENQSDGYFTLRACYTDLYLDAANGSSTAGTNVQLYEGNGSNAQRWRLLDGGNGTYHIVSKLNENMNWDCTGAGTANGTNIQLWTRENVNWHKWVFTRVAVPKGNVIGDVNSDWKVSQADLDLLKQYRIGTAKLIHKLNADMNGDGKVDLTDIAQLSAKVKKNNNNTTSIGSATQTQSVVKPVQTTTQVPFRKVANGLVICYDNPNGNQSGWIDRNDDVEVTELRGEWARGNYPSGNRRITRWFKLADLTRESAPKTAISFYVPYYWQQNPQWGNVYIGNKTIGAIGCTTTCLAMKYSAQFNQDIKPNDMRYKLSYSNNDLIWSSIKQFGFLQRSAHALDNKYMRDIHSNLKNGRPVLIGGYVGNSDSQHWVLIVGYKGNSSFDSMTANDFVIFDPMNENNKNLKDYINKYNRIKGYVF